MLTRMLSWRATLLARAHPHGRTPSLPGQVWARHTNVATTACRLRNRCLLTVERLGGEADDEAVGCVGAADAVDEVPGDPESGAGPDRRGGWEIAREGLVVAGAL